MSLGRTSANKYRSEVSDPACRRQAGIERPTPLHSRAVIASLCMIFFGFGATTAVACPFPLPPVRDLALERFYADDAGSVVDPALMAEHRAETAPVRDFLKTVVAQADDSLREESSSMAAYHAKCALEHLDVWAKGGALLGAITTKQAEAERRWTLAGAALAYLKVKSHATAEQKSTIEPWLVKLADASRRAFDDVSVKRNNHWYWMGLAAGATSLATGSERHWQSARAIMQDAARDIAADGALPKEMQREARALHYHTFALTALVALAELAHSRNEDFYALGNGALDRLAELTAQGITDPALFDRLAGVQQERPISPGWGWLALYRGARPDSLPDFNTEMPTGHRWLGGNVALLHKVLVGAK